MFVPVPVVRDIPEPDVIPRFMAAIEQVRMCPIFSHQFDLYRH